VLNLWVIERLHDPLPTVTGNAVQLQQVFQNLIGNAIKFRSHDAPVIQIEAKPLGADWEFSIQDNGIGIAPEQVDGIFTIFRRLHTRTEYPGNGIGLAICKRIIEQHGGKIWVETQPGPGTSFHFTVAGTQTESAQTKEDETQHEKAVASVVGG
jgi:chemotaxis family two-component system sensor kinase Cph1